MLRFLALSSLIFALTACGQAKFNASKSDVIGKSSVFGDATGQITQPGQSGGGDSEGRINQPPLPADLKKWLSQFEGEVSTCQNGQYVPVDLSKFTTRSEIPFQLVCSDSDSRQSTNFKKAVAQNLLVELRVNNIVCTTDKTAIQNILIKGKITVADVQALCPSALVNGSLKFVSVEIDPARCKDDRREGDDRAIEVLWARNRDQSVTAEAADSHCDRRSSPLVVHRTSDPSNPQPIALSSREDGVDFDLLGAKNDYEKVRISWFTNHDYQFLALPNRRGGVNGIDELFGDSTLGPDGEFAENGYAALAKYDGTTADGMFRLAPADGIIDAKDAVYSRLRLWADRNFNGKAERSELTSLARAGIVYVDLEFSDDFEERDQHGNVTKMKSVVGNADGSMDLIFDLWFAY